MPNRTHLDTPAIAVAVLVAVTGCEEPLVTIDLAESQPKVDQHEYVITLRTEDGEAVSAHMEHGEVLAESWDCRLVSDGTKQLVVRVDPTMQAILRARLFGQARCDTSDEEVASDVLIIPPTVTDGAAGASSSASASGTGASSTSSGTAGAGAAGGGGGTAGSSGGGPSGGAGGGLSAGGSGGVP